MPARGWRSRKRSLLCTLGRVPSPVWASDFTSLNTSTEETVGGYYGVESGP